MKKGFTLAEVLITLGIIGVVAAMTLPTLINNYQKKVAAVRLEHAYSLVAQAIRLSEVENGPMKNWVVGTLEDGAPVGTSEKITGAFVKQYIQPYLKEANEDLMPTSSMPYDYYYYTRNGELASGGGHTHYSIALVNGTYLHFNANYNTSKNIELRIDINGMQKPNVLGRDTFYARFYPKFEFVGNEQTRARALELCKGETKNHQAYCGSVIQKDGWEIKKDYPW